MQNYYLLKLIMNILLLNLLFEKLKQILLCFIIDFIYGQKILNNN